MRNVFECLLVPHELFILRSIFQTILTSNRQYTAYKVRSDLQMSMPMPIINHFYKMHC